MVVAHPKGIAVEHIVQGNDFAFEPCPQLGIDRQGLLGGHGHPPISVPTLFFRLLSIFGAVPRSVDVDRDNHAGPFVSLTTATGSRMAESKSVIAVVSRQPSTVS